MYFLKEHSVGALRGGQWWGVASGMDWPSQRHYRPSLPAPIDMLVYYAALAGLVGVFAVRPASTTAGFTV
jgi:hypothetical protein